MSKADEALRLRGPSASLGSPREGSVSVGKVKSKGLSMERLVGLDMVRKDEDWSLQRLVVGYRGTVHTEWWWWWW